MNRKGEWKREWLVVHLLWHVRFRLLFHEKSLDAFLSVRITGQCAQCLKQGENIMSQFFNRNTVEPAYKVNVLSKENWFYERANLISGS